MLNILHGAQHFFEARIPPPTVNVRAYVAAYLERGDKPSFLSVVRSFLAMAVYSSYRIGEAKTQGSVSAMA
jgi:hypothetical protein